MPSRATLKRSPKPLSLAVGISRPDCTSCCTGIVAVSRNVTWSEIYERLTTAPPGKLYGIPRGGAIVAGLTGRAVDHADQADWVVDDVIDSGTTGALAQLWNKPLWGLFDRSKDAIGDHEVAFPWEGPADRAKKLEHIGRE